MIDLEDYLSGAISGPESVGNGYFLVDTSSVGDREEYLPSFVVYNEEEILYVSKIGKDRYDIEVEDRETGEGIYGSDRYVGDDVMSELEVRGIDTKIFEGNKSHRHIDLRANILLGLYDDYPLEKMSIDLPLPTQSWE